MITVVIPTLTVRREAGWTDRCISAYHETMRGVEHEILVYVDRSGCGVAWNDGLAVAEGEYVHLTADDITPHQGWWQAAIEVADRGELPSALILNADGTLQSCGTDHLPHPDGEEAFVARIPFATREQYVAIGPMMENHYMGDYWFSHRGRECGYKSIVTHAYQFTHHYAQEGRIDTLDADVEDYYARGGE